MVSCHNDPRAKEGTAGQQRAERADWNPAADQTVTALTHQALRGHMVTIVTETPLLSTQMMENKLSVVKKGKNATTSAVARNDQLINKLKWLECDVSWQHDWQRWNCLPHWDLHCLEHNPHLILFPTKRKMWSLKMKYAIGYFQSSVIFTLCSQKSGLKFFKTSKRFSILERKRKRTAQIE